MLNEWYEINWVGTNRAFLVGHNNDRDVEFELNAERIERVWAHSEAMQKLQQDFYRDLVNES